MIQRTIEFPVPEASKLARQQSAVLSRLREGAATSEDLNLVCYRFSARIHELRKQGFDITTRKVAGMAVYSLKEPA